MRWDHDTLRGFPRRGSAPVFMRLIRPDDKQHLDPSRLSAQSQIHRFMSPKPRLSGRELSYLTEVDHLHHLALVALERREGVEVGLGVARFIEVRPGVAELAVTIADDAQRRGLGSLMFRELLAAARERGVEQMEAWVMTENAAALRMVRRALPHLEQRTEGSLHVLSARI
jgi:GNAT superfamily N-acetyltransferase